MNQVGEDDLSSRISRLVSLLPWLAANRDATAKEAADRFGVTEEQLMQDVLLLTMTGPNQYGGGLVDIAYDSRVLTVRDAKGLASSAIEEPRALYPLILALELLAASMSDSEASIARGLLTKLKKAAEMPEAVVAVAATTEYEDASAERHLIARAIEAKSAIEFDYEAPQGVMTKRWVLPRGLTLNDSVWYVSAWDLEKQAERVFRLDRVRELQTSRRLVEQASLPSSIEDDDAGGEAQTRFFWLNIAAAAAPALEDFSNWQVVEATDTVLRVQFPRYRDEWAAQTALSFWPWLEEVDPPDLKENVVRRLMALQAAHKA